MHAKAVTCPSAQVLADFERGKLDGSRADTVGQHLETCADCRVTVDKLRRVLGRKAQSHPGAARPGQFMPEETQAHVAHEAISDSAPDTHTEPGRAASSGRPAASSPAALTSIPSELDQHPDYELLKELGRGGMGVVYLARNRMMDRLEVLKVLSQSLLDRPGARERFQQEIRLAAKLAHPNIVAAYSVLRPGDLLVFAMEFVDGQDLSQVVKQRGPLPVTNATFYVQQVALGLGHAHEMGMVHRDVKPTNLMLAIKNKKHVVKILDFGLAKATSEKAIDAGLTKSGQMLGTPHYIAPEQTLDAQKADIRADIYSLGCTLYYLLAGSPPFRGDSMFAILQAHHQAEAQPLNQLRSDVPAELAAVVSTMMAKDPNQRYQTPAEVAKALKRFFKAGPSVRVEPAAKPDLPPSAIDEPEAGGVAAAPREEPLLEEPQLEEMPTPAIPFVQLPAAPTSIPTPQFAAQAVANPYMWNPLDDLLCVQPAPRRRHEEQHEEPLLPNSHWPLWAAATGAALLATAIGAGAALFFNSKPSNNVTTGQVKTLKPVIGSSASAHPVGGFLPLFNGRNLTGWKMHSDQPGNWTVQNGILKGRGPLVSHLYSERSDYQNVHVRAKVRIHQGGHAGIYVRASFGSGESPPWPDGYKTQISVGDALNKTGGLQIGKDVVARVSTSPVQADELFELEIKAEGARIVTLVNGRVMADYIDPQSRFTAGHIALQCGGSSTMVDFESIEIKELPSTP